MSHDKMDRHHVKVMSQYNAQCFAIRDALKNKGFINSNVTTAVSSQGKLHERYDFQHQSLGLLQYIFCIFISQVNTTAFLNRLPSKTDVLHIRSSEKSKYQNYVYREHLFYTGDILSIAIAIRSPTADVFCNIKSVSISHLFYFTMDFGL